MYLQEKERIMETDIFRACCGLDEEGYSRSVSAVKMLFFSEEAEPEEFDEIISDHPVVNIYRDSLRTMIDLTFENPADYEFTNLVLRLQEFSRLELSEEREAVPSVMVTVSPKEWMGRVYLSAIHAMWCLMPEMPGGKINTVRFIFDNETVDCFQIDEEVFDEGEDEYEEGL